MLTHTHDIDSRSNCLYNYRNHLHPRLLWLPITHPSRVLAPTGDHGRRKTPSECLLRCVRRTHPASCVECVRHYILMRSAASR